MGRKGKGKGAGKGSDKKTEPREDPGNAFDQGTAQKAILDYLQRPEYRPMVERQLLRQLHVPDELRSRLRRLVKELLEQGKIVRIGGHRLVAAGAAGRDDRGVRGRLELHAEGYGFVIPGDGGEHVFVPRRHVGDAHHGDTVAVRVSGEGRRGKLEGVIVGVLAHADTRHMGVFRQVGRGGRVEPFESGHGPAFTVPAAFRHDARDGDAVEIEVVRGRGGPRNRDAKVVRVVGRVDEPGVDVMVVALRHGLALQFPPEVLEEAARLPADPAPGESSGRERFDEPPAVTIDGETAQDFDDAVAIAPLPRGGFRLFVHIADVAHYVAHGSALDLEARARGTSVYFPGKVLPMFPERLSNDLCSLRPGRDRLVQSAILDLTASGELRKVRFADGVIRSAARLTYGQVAAALDGSSGHGVPESLRPMLDLMDRLREQLERRRRERGSLDFDLPEPEILLDVEGAVTGVKIEPRNRAHLLIEEFMLAANEAVAGHLQDQGAPCVYRVHDTPDPVKLSALREFVEGLGLKPPGGKGEMSPAHLRKLLESIAGRPEYPVVAQVVLRSMRQASYDTRNIGHFGLAAPVYCHFTSPIRRYPDLMVHRLLRASRRRRGPELSRLGHGLQGLAEAASTLERNAEAAERELLAWKTMVFMKGREGEEVEGVVVGVTAFGLFVRLTETQIEGLLRVEELGDDRFDFVEGRMELRGGRTGRVFRLGQPLRVRIARVDTVLRRLDLARPGQPARASRRTAPAAVKPARGTRRPGPRRMRPRGR